VEEASCAAFTFGRQVIDVAGVAGTVSV